MCPPSGNQKCNVWQHLSLNPQQKIIEVIVCMAILQPFINHINANIDDTQ